MLNILLTHPEGKDATGLAILREATARALPSDQITTILPKRSQPFSSFTTDPTFHDAAVEETGERAFLVDSTPADLIRRAFLHFDLFTTRPWDMVLIGVNPTLITGMDIFDHASTAAAMLAASAYLTYTICFNQELDDPAQPNERELYAPATKIIPHYLKTTPTEKGRCWNLNIPSKSALHKGYKETPSAHYSPLNLPPTSLVPRARQENSDVTAVEQGFTAVTPLQLRVNPSMRY